MEMIGMIVGMALAFLLGAYIRKPFVWRKAQPTVVVQEQPSEEGERKQDKIAQLNNLLCYTGKAQTEDEFEH